METAASFEVRNAPSSYPTATRHRPTRPVRASILPDLLSIPPSLSVSRAVQYLKGRSSHKLLAEFASLRKCYWGQHLWARGYWVASSGNVTDKVWMEYIKSQTQPEPDDDFRVT
jgi:putative transposase